MARILVVDDDPEVVDVCKMILEKEGHEVFGAMSRQEGAQAIQSNPPDLLILDVVMQQHDDGFAMAQQLRKHGFTAPILMLSSISKVTGYSYQKSDQMAPVDAFEEKPLSPKKLIERVNELLAAKEAKA